MFFELRDSESIVHLNSENFSLYLVRYFFPGGEMVVRGRL